MQIHFAINHYNKILKILFYLKTVYATISSIDLTTKSEEILNDRIVYMEDLEKRKEAYQLLCM